MTSILVYILVLGLRSREVKKLALDHTQRGHPGPSDRRALLFINKGKLTSICLVLFFLSSTPVYDCQQIPGLPAQKC